MVSMRYSFRKNESNLSKKKMILYLIRDNRRISLKKKKYETIYTSILYRVSHKYFYISN